MIISFTGTSRKKPTEAQTISLMKLLEEARSNGYHILSHGEAPNADKVANNCAHMAGMETRSHPWTGNKTLRGYPIRFRYVDDRREPKDDPIERNHDIVDEGEFLIAMPSEPEYTRSGTWATVRYARKLHRTIAIIWPDGRVEWE